MFYYFFHFTASLQSDNQLDNTSVTLKQKPVVGDVVSAGGLSITAILKGALIKYPKFVYSEVYISNLTLNLYL